MPTRPEFDKLTNEIREKISKFEDKIGNMSEILRRYDEILCDKASKAAIFAQN